MAKDYQENVFALTNHHTKCSVQGQDICALAETLGPFHHKQSPLFYFWKLHKYMELRPKARAI